MHLIEDQPLPVTAGSLSDTNVAWMTDSPTLTPSGSHTAHKQNKSASYND